jgi:hypothetical protein
LPPRDEHELNRCRSQINEALRVLQDEGHDVKSAIELALAEIAYGRAVRSARARAAEAESRWLAAAGDARAARERIEQGRYLHSGADLDTLLGSAKLLDSGHYLDRSMLFRAMLQLTCAIFALDEEPMAESELASLVKPFGIDLAALEPAKVIRNALASTWASNPHPTADAPSEPAPPSTPPDNLPNNLKDVEHIVERFKRLDLD